MLLPAGSRHTSTVPGWSSSPPIEQLAVSQVSKTSSSAPWTPAAAITVAKQNVALPQANELPRLPLAKVPLSTRARGSIDDAARQSASSPPRSPRRHDRAGLAEREDGFLLTLKFPATIARDGVLELVKTDSEILAMVAVDPGSKHAGQWRGK